MSFAGDVKCEIIEHSAVKGCCIIAACYGIACFSKYFDTKGLILHTERSDVAFYAKKLFDKIGINGEIITKGKEDSHIYEYAIKDEAEINKLLLLLHYDKNEVALRINSDNFKCEHCVNAFVSSAFLCAGTMTDPNKEYNLELLTSRHHLARDLQALLMGHGFASGNIVRKGANVIYFKASEQIEDILTFMGASNAAIEIMNLKVYKDFRNKANRITNCETANIDKTVNANSKTLRAIEYLKAHNAFDTLPFALKEAAELREENPDLSLKELSCLFIPHLSRSGLNHRLKNIEQAANHLEIRSKNV
ncbi:MAG: DNA-binding protein WhiA [Oscillospiraceae bacterium]